MDDDYNVYRQSCFNTNLPSLKKYFVYLANDKGETYRLCFYSMCLLKEKQQYIFNLAEMANVVPAKANNAKYYGSDLRRKGPHEIMHAIIDDRDGTDNITSSEEYPRDQGQIYHAHSKSSNGSAESYLIIDPLAELLQISKSQ